MYNLKKIKNLDKCEPIQALCIDLPQKPYCTNAKGFCHIRTKSLALNHSYIQPNHPASVKWLVFDIDDPNAIFAYYDNDVPPPQLIIKNPQNGHAHYCYKLAENVGLWGNSSVKAINYLRAVYNALQRKLGADSGYSGNLIKNPLHSDWETYITGAKPSYELAELAEYLVLQPMSKKQQASNEDYFGRNCNLFNKIRLIAYKISDLYSERELYNELLAKLEQENLSFDNPLFPNELKHIAKSISKYCKSSRFIEQQKQSEKRFSELQTSRIKNRWGDNTTKKEKALEMAKNGFKINDIIKELEVNRSTLTRWGIKNITTKKEKALEMAKNGFKIKDISQELGVNRSTLNRWKIKPPKKSNKNR